LKKEIAKNFHCIKYPPFDNLSALAMNGVVSNLMTPPLLNSVERKFK